ncbi:hypothetical protein F2P81_012618 [Scophthalmus maximus]|uniref:ILEI/PANDER domain-containing protein n=1 Tax=Scophthalmus maximus TaxID=52904 RepID=A0A6A4SSL1_SCOMX|nr:hypothetical protein F2P81_012618 [Scophthalmus maximus]
MPTRALLYALYYLFDRECFGCGSCPERRRGVCFVADMKHALWYFAAVIAILITWQISSRSFDIKTRAGNLLGFNDKQQMRLQLRLGETGNLDGYRLLSGNSGAVLAYLSQIDPGMFVFVASYDNVEDKLSKEVREYFVEMGSTMVQSIKYRDSWVFAGRVGTRKKLFETNQLDFNRHSVLFAARRMRGEEQPKGKELMIHACQLEKWDEKRNIGRKNGAAEDCTTLAGQLTNNAARCRHDDIPFDL